MVVLNLSDLKRHTSKWLYPLILLREDGRTLILQSTEPKAETKAFLRENHLMEVFEDILYTDLEPPTATALRHLPPLCKRQWTRTRLTWAVNLGGA